MFVLFLLIIVLLSTYYKVFIALKNNSSTIMIKNLSIIDSTSTQYSIEEKTEAIKVLKDLSLDESVQKGVRVISGEKVVSNFFNSGVIHAKGFSTSTDFNEKEVYEYAKYINSLGGTGRNNLLAAYIGLRFYDNEETRESISSSLHSYQEYVKKNGDTNACGNGSKFASVIYLSQKSKHADVSDEFGDYYTNFEKVYSTQCGEDRKPLVAFMWLAAISDIGSSTKENDKARELLSVVTKDTTDSSRLVRNLKQSYFVQNKEPDTASIVERLVIKYPEFKDFIERIK